MSEEQRYVVEIFAPAQRDFDGAELIEFFKLRELLSKGLSLFHNHSNRVPFEIKLTLGSAPSYVKDLLSSGSFQLRGFDYSDSDFVSLSCEMEFNKNLIKTYIKSNPGKSEKDYRDVFRNHFASISSEIFEHAIICMNIAAPGIFYCAEGAIFIDKKFFRRTFASFHTIENCAFTAKELGIPIVRELDFQDCWKFYSSLNGAFINLSSTKLERSVAYFARLFRMNHSNDIGSNLIWSVSGIEALLAEGDRGIERQIRERLRALIPGLFLDKFETKIKEMYQVRSRLLHGQFDISISDYSQKWESYSEYTKIRDAEDVAMLILIFIIQYCFCRKGHEIKFQTVILP